MKAKRNHFVFTAALLLLLFCSVLLFACNSVSNLHGDDAGAEEAEIANTDDLALATSQLTTLDNKSNSESSTVTVASTSKTKTGIYLGGGEITSDRSYGAGWNYNFKSNTLTLNGYYSPTSLDNTLGLTKALFPDFNGKSSQAHLAIDSSVCTSLTIKVVGENLSHFGDLDDTDDYDKDGYNYYGIYAPGVDLTMEIEDDYAPMKYNPVYYPLEIYTHRDAVYCKSLTLTGGGGLWADSCIGSGIRCQDLSVTKNRLLVYTQHGNNIYHGTVGHTTAAILASGSVTFDKAYVEVYVQNTAPKVGSTWAAYMIDVYGIKADSLNIKSGARVNVEMSFASDVTQNVTFKATGIYASSCTSYDGGKLHTKISTNDTMPDDAYLCGCYIENYAYFLGGNTTISGELLRSGSKSFKLESFMHTFPLPGGSMSKSTEDTKYSYTANTDAIYLRNNGGTLQYSTSFLFNDPKTLSSNEIDMADFSGIGSQKNVYSVSGDWKIKPIPGDHKSTFVALGGSITLKMSDGNTYDSFALYTYTGAAIYVSGDGIVNSLDANGCNDVGVERFVSYGTVYFNSGTVKSGNINDNCKVVFYGGNINVDYNDPSDSSPYHKWTFDFGEYADLLSFQTDLTFSSSTYDRTGLYPIDGKLYTWDKYQTTGLLYRYFKYATVRPTDGYTYYLYPKAAEEERTFTVQRLAETDVFIAKNDLKSKYYLADGDTLTLSVGVFGKQVTRPVTEFGGTSSTEVLEGTTKAIIPDGFTVKWTRTDKDGKTTQIGSELTLTAKLDALKDDGSVYTCTVSRGNTQVSKLEFSVYVFGYNPNGLMPKKAGKDETVSFTFSFDDFKGYNDWIASNYSFIWQIDEDGSGSFVDISGTQDQSSLSVKITSDDSYKAVYRVKIYSSQYYVEGSAMRSFPTFYTITAKTTFRELPSFSGELIVTPADNHAGVTKNYTINLQNCYVGVVDVWYEYSTDNGQTWQRALSHSAFSDGLSIIFNSTYVSPYGNSQSYSWYGSLSINVALSTEMNGWKLRCVMQSGDYVVYSNEATFTVLDFAGFTVQPKDTVTVKSTDPLSLSAVFEEDYKDEDGNGISDITYEWLYEAWSNGGYDRVKDANKITSNTLYYETAAGIGSVSRYRLQVKFKYKGVDYTRYSDYAYVYVLYQPAFDDGGVVISNMADGIYTEGDSVSWKVNDNGVFFHYYKTYQFEVSKDGGDTWQSVGEAFTQSYKNILFTFDLQDLSVADGGLYRCKVSIEKNGVTVCSYSDVVSVSVISSLSVDDSQGYAATSTGKAVLAAKHEYSSNLSVTYQWQGYDSALGWVKLAGEKYFDTDKQAMYTFGASLPLYEKYRCLVIYKLNDDISVNAYTNEVAPVLVAKPAITAEPVDQTVWLGNAVKFILWIDDPANHTVLWEVSNDGGKTWENAVDVIQGGSGETDYSLLCNTTTYDMNGAMFRCTVTNAIKDVSETVVTEPVTLTVKSGHVRTEQELSDALKNGMTEIKLLDDIALSATLIVNKNIVLDLNGHVLSYQNNKTSGSVIRIVDNATITLTDSMPTTVHSDDKLPLGGIISGGTGCALGTGMRSARTTGSTFGGGILIEKGSLMFVGGTVYNCRATYGGGIYVSEQSYLSLEGGVVSGCNATEGGGIYSASDIDIKGGSITGCTTSEEAENDNASGALYLKQSTLNASGGSVNGTVTLEGSSVVLPDGSVSSTEFLKTVYCDDSKIKGGFYSSDVINADTSESATVTYMNGDQVVTKLIIELGQKAVSVSIPDAGDKLLLWFKGDVAYDFNDPVTEDLVLTAKWYVRSEVADSLTDELDKTRSELNEAKNDISEAQSELNDLNGSLNNAAEDINKLNDKLGAVTAWMIVSIVMFGLSCGASVTLLILFKRKK